MLTLQWEIYHISFFAVKVFQLLDGKFFHLKKIPLYHFQTIYWQFRLEERAWSLESGKDMLGCLPCYCVTFVLNSLDLSESYHCYLLKGHQNFLCD